MDAVITYVNGNDPIWQKEYETYFGREILDKRFRDWGTLKYLLRGIETYMRYIDNVYLVVSGDSQVPSWLNTETVKIVRHADFIPEKFLPTFNSNPLEMYLHTIPGLSEEYIYMNDDFFPVAESTREDFFRDGKAVMSPSRDILSLNMFKKICRNSYNLARKASGKESLSLFFLRPQHICAPMLKSVCEELFSKEREAIDLTAARRLRTEKDLTQYIYSDYMYLTGHTVPGRVSNRHFSLASASLDRIVSFLDSPDRKFTCINDVKLSEDKFNTYRNAILSAFERRLGKKSKFEI